MEKRIKTDQLYPIYWKCGQFMKEADSKISNLGFNSSFELDFDPKTLFHGIFSEKPGKISEKFRKKVISIPK